MSAPSIQDVQDIIDELESVSEERIRAEERFKKELETLEELGCSSIEEGSKKAAKLDSKIDKLNDEVNEEFENFIEDYGSLF